VKPLIVGSRSGPHKPIIQIWDIDLSIGSTSIISFGLQEERGKPAPRKTMKVPSIARRAA
jgi:hypothetical protein